MKCPAGHQSSTPDYCDVCGSPMGAAASAPEAPATPAPAAPSSLDLPGTPPGAPAAPALQTCPHCQAANSETNLFCEVCGFDFTTGVMPRVEGGEPSFLAPVVAPTPAEPGTPATPRSPSHDTDAATPAAEEPSAPGPDVRGSGGSAEQAAGSVLDLDAGPGPDENRAAAGAAEGPDAAAVPSSPGPDTEMQTALEPPTPSDPTDPPAGPSGARAGDSAHPGTPGTPGTAPDAPLAPPEDQAGGDVATPAPETGPGTATPDGEEPVPDPVRSAPKPVNRPPSREVAGDWVVEVWIDPDWYAAQDTAEPCPSAAPPDIVRLRGSDALIGRRSRSSAPDIDCGIDSAVSRRQALLASDGRRWWVEDLDSSNGTWVGPAIGPLPSEPISARTEVDADDRIYVGAWTRLVVRPAVESELTEG